MPPGAGTPVALGAARSSANEHGGFGVLEAHVIVELDRFDPRVVHQ